MEAMAIPATCASVRCMVLEDCEPLVGEDNMDACVAVEELVVVAIAGTGELLVDVLPAVDVGDMAVTTTVLCVGITALLCPVHMV